MTERAVDYLRVSTAEQAEKDLDEGYSIPAQREACVARIRHEGWTLVDEYVDSGESARSTDRPKLLAMLERIERDRDIDVVVVHKIDRLARNIEDHVAIRAALRRAGVRLVSVSENLEETASGKLVEGIHALMAEFYSANLAAEVRKGMTQKAKQGGWPQMAPLGYLNVRQTIGGRRIATITPDPDRADLVRAAFQLYATGDWTLERLLAELHKRGLRNRGTRKRPPGAVSLNGLSLILSNPAYLGVVEWGGVRYPGQHDPLVDPATFQKVQDLLAARAARGTRERKHPHYLKGLLHCAVCGRRLSVQLSKGRYLYFYCLGQKIDGPTLCREPYTPADRLEDQVGKLYQRVQLPQQVVDRHRRTAKRDRRADQRHAAERELQTRRMAGIADRRRKLLDAY
jgi:DNA invertase Pin-like site-specific DNA recombinase